MPSYRFVCPQAMAYTGLRDEHDVHLGQVNPGDVRDLNEAPDQWWVPAEGQDDDRREDKSGDDGSGTPEGSAPDLAAESEADPSAPVPAPPAVIANP
jgi:hypothetical protein